MISYTVKNRANPAPLGGTRILGSVKEQMDIFFEKRIFSDFAKSTVYRETLDAFIAKRDDNTAIGYWQGEFWGKWVISACRVATYENDEALKSFLHGCGKELLALQREDGYIGTYKNSKNMLPPPDEVSIALEGVPVPHNWNVWVRKYTLWGLLEIYLMTKDGEMLRGAARSADCLMRELDELGFHLVDVGTFNGLPACSIFKPMLILYSLTEDRRYLDFCIEEAKYLEREDGKKPNLIANFLAEKPIHTWYPESNKWAKTYELLSCLDGLIELYRHTGNEKYLKTAINGHKLIKEHEYNAVFGISCNDVFFNAANIENSCTEPCDTIHWMRVCYELFTLTLNTEYLDDFEESFYSPFLAASYSNGEWGARGVRSSGRHMTCSGQAKMAHSHCCVNNMPRGYMNFADCAVMSNADTVYLNMFTELAARVKLADNEVTLTVGGGYLECGHTELRVNADKQTKLAVRIPAFSKTARITVKNADKTCEILCTGGGYSTVSLPAGESVLLLDFDMMARVVDFEGEHITPGEEGDYATRRYIQQAPLPFDTLVIGRYSRVLYGPLLLTRSKKCGNTEEEMFRDTSTVYGTDCKATVTPLKADGTRLKFKVALKGCGVEKELTMCDYATGSNEWSKDDPYLFSIWV